MSRKRNFKVNYSIMVNGEEYPREVTIKSVTSEETAEIKLRDMCKGEIVITSIERI